MSTDTTTGTVGSAVSGVTPVSSVSTDTSASLVTDGTTGTTGSGATPVSAVSTDTPASLVTDGTTGTTGSGATPVSAVSTDTPASLVTDGTTGTTGIVTTHVLAVSTDTPASLVTDGTTGTTGSGATPVSAVSTDTPASLVTDGTTGTTGSGATPVSAVSTDTPASLVTDGTTGAIGSGATPASPVSRFNRSGQLLTAITVPLGVTILVFLVLCGCWIRCLCRQKIRSSSPVELISSRFVTNPGYNPNETDSNSSEGEPEEYADIDDKLIRISDLVIYVKQKKQNRKDNFFTEFKTLPTDQLYPCTVAGKPENKSKNRYLNILPYDNSRVMLKQVIDGPHSDYINASYIDGYKAPKKFIATQGPNEASLVDFWQMVWQENVATIVMLTSLIDGKKKVCLKYWPDQESIYGDLLVKCEKLEEHFQYDYRMFTIALKHGGESRTVKHFHFTDWGDMKIPEFLDPILAFLEIVRNNTSQKKVPNTIVHCSAGVGRTGTYITLDAMLDMAQAEGKVNVYKFVTEMRQRGDSLYKSSQKHISQICNKNSLMGQNRSIDTMSALLVYINENEEQYQFIFDTLVKKFCIGRTTLSVKSFGMALASLKRTNDETGETYLTEQFKKLEEISVTTSSSDMYAAKNMENKSQNQCSTFLPVEAHTPVLKTPVGERNSRYINASLMDGYKKMDFFVATQMPLKNTVLDFWNLVWDHECSVIIMLNELDDKSDQYWPESTSVTFSPFTIKSLSIEHRGTIVFAKLRLQTQLCRDGVGRTGVFCGLVAALDQAQAVKEVDIFQLISNMRSAQPLMIQNQEQYQTIFDAVLMHLETGSGTD
ncbi:putative receptor-type tyrosine-protein phosphatase T isoform X2 [Apostichopus japonicus]|uniref:protein-tyrosine-phosphatase n=1 Tax=Stichopus japonicus TaxID=307972 RepID=A0A2G8KFU7_STIJA|nr:putative receptor-type tyrosine-protein phosphatase T isoform X2 [Apostichopus japonicus]